MKNEEDYLFPILFPVLAINTLKETQVKMYKREVNRNKEQDGGEKTDSDAAIDGQAGIGIGFLLGII